MDYSIYIDRVTGTWGSTADLIVLDPDIEGMFMDPSGGDDATCISALESLDSDSEIIQIAEHAYERGHGIRLAALLQYYNQIGGDA